MKVLTFGEIMLRLRAPWHERLFQSGSLEATFGGGEANVAVSLANYGMDAAYLTVLPDNAIGDACTGSNPRQPSQEEMEKLLKCCYYDTEVDF